MDYSFNADVAKKYGVNEAIFLQNLYFWIFKNRANGRYDFDGKNWTYNSMDAFTQLFPFWTVAQIRNIIKKLEANGAIYIGNYNTDWSNRTKWYALSEEVLELYNGVNSDLLKVANAFDRNSKCQLSELANDICQKQQMTIARNDKCYKEQIVNTDSKQQIVNTDIGDKPQKKFIPPSLAEVQAYCLERRNDVDPKKFIDYFSASGWVDSAGKPVRNWKQKIITWEGSRKPATTNNPFLKKLQEAEDEPNRDF